MGLSGHCLCEGIRFRIDGPLGPVVNSHSEEARRTTGHFLAATACHRDHVIIESDETLSWFRPKDDVKFGFCNRCGATVFWHTDANPESVSISAGMFDVPTGLTTEFALWTSLASDYYTLDESLVSFPQGADTPE